MFIADLHIHSTFSDGRLAIPEIVDLYGAQGVGAIAITDHLCESDTVLGKAAAMINRTLTPAVFPLYQEILKSEARRAWKQYRMVLIPGVELTKSSMFQRRSVRILGLGIREFIKAEGSVKELGSAIKAQGGVSVATYSETLWEQRKELGDSIDAWEISTGKRLHTRVLASRVPKIAGSGLHSAKHFDSWKTVLHCERSEEAILEAIRQQELKFTFYGAQPSHGDKNDLTRIDSIWNLTRHDRAQPLGHPLGALALSRKKSEQSEPLSG